MDEFKSEDELRPDSSDRRPPRQRKGPSVPKVAMSRQHMMIGVGILVLLLVVIGVGSALKSPTQPDAGKQNQASTEKNIDLSGSSAPAGNDGAPSAANPSNPAAPATPAAPGVTNGQGNVTANGVVNGGNGSSQQPQPLSAPEVAPAPTVAPPVAGAAPQHRIDLPGNMADALSQQGDRVNGMTEQMNNDGQSSTLPTAPATVAPSGKEPAHKAGAVKAPATVHKGAKRVETTIGGTAAVKAPAAGAAHTVAPRAMATAGQHAPASVASQHVPAAPAPSRHTAVAASSGAIQSAPAGFYTLQLSSASQATTLNAYAQKQQLSQYWVYETRREGKPWYVLVSGVYPTSSQAKSAVAQLPAAVQANKPWARQIGQVKQDQNK